MGAKEQGYYGVYPARVIDNVDPQGLGRLLVQVPWSAEGAEKGTQAWARLATFMAGAKRGAWFIPEVDDEVLVGFAGGDPRQPYVLGSLWSETAPPPEAMDVPGENNRKALVSRQGLRITLDDAAQQEAVSIETPGGQRLILQDGAASVEIEDSGGNRIVFEPSGISIQAASKVTISASVVEIDAGMLKVNAGVAQFSGVVQADTLIANSVVASSYTPGAGNVM